MYLKLYSPWAKTELKNREKKQKWAAPEHWTEFVERLSNGKWCANANSNAQKTRWTISSEQLGRYYPTVSQKVYKIRQ